MLHYDYYSTRADGKRLQHIYTDDETKKILQVETGIIYDDVIDFEDTSYSYEETDKREEITNE